eukprot:UC4_evm1s619
MSRVGPVPDNHENNGYDDTVLEVVDLNNSNIANHPIASQNIERGTPISSKTRMKGAVLATAAAAWRRRSVAVATAMREAGVDVKGIKTNSRSDTNDEIKEVL